MTSLRLPNVALATVRPENLVCRTEYFDDRDNIVDFRRSMTFKNASCTSSSNQVVATTGSGNSQ